MKKIIVLFVNIVFASSSAIANSSIQDVLANALEKSTLYVHNGIGDCSGSFIQFNGMPNERNALVLTNGHCSGLGSYLGQYPDHGEIFINKSTDVRFSKNNVIFQATKLIFGSMTGIDIAIYEVSKTYSEVKASGFEILKVASESILNEGDLVGFSSQYWRNSWICKVAGQNLTIDEGPWRWTVGIGLVGAQCTARPGSSGSPLLNQKGDIIGTINTENSGEKDCSLMNPCEVNTDGSKFSQNKKVYAMDVVELNKCVKSGYFDPTSDECPLPLNPSIRK